MKRTISIGIIGILLSAILLASVPSAMGAQFFGDANEDGAIDIKDVTYVKLINKGRNIRKADNFRKEVDYRVSRCKSGRKDKRG
jgi:hypothetical protein